MIVAKVTLSVLQVKEVDGLLVLLLDAVLLDEHRASLGLCLKLNALN